MPSQSFLSKKFAVGEFLKLRDSITNLPYEGKLNYHLALDNKCPTLKNLQSSYGFPVERLSKGKPLYRVTCPEDFRPARERYAELDTEFKRWNDPSLTCHQRLMLGETKPPGFALVVRKGADGELCHLCFISAPVMTKPNTSADSGFGAPLLADIFEATVTNHLQCPRPVDEPNHLMLGSLCGTTLGVSLDKGRRAFAEALFPVIMSDGLALGQKPLNGDSWKILIFPFMSECPVGFVWPATISYAEFCDSLENRNSKVFGGLKPSEGKSSLSKGKLIAFDKLNVKMDPEDEMYSFEEEVLLSPPSEAEFNRTFRCMFACCRDGNHGHGAIENDEMLESFLNHPPLEVMPNPITMANIQQHQLQDVALIQKSQNAATWAQYPIMQIDNRNVICYRADLNKPNEWRIHLPETLVAPVIVWYHLVLGHRGTTSLYNTIVRWFYAPALKRKVESLRCEVCQVNKNVNIQYGHLPERHADLVPWFSVAVDLIGPWKIKVNEQNVTNVFENLWLSRYPKPYKCIHDQGGEFIGHDFQLKLQQWGIHDASATSKNPTANAICERMHQTVGNILRTRFNNTNMAPNIQTANQAVDDALAACNRAMRCAVSQSLKNNTPGEVVFARDMLLNIPVIVDLLSIQEKRQLMVNANLRQQNAKRKEFDYNVGGEVLIKNFNPSKLDPKMEGPYQITRVFTNGTVEVRRSPQVFERLNILRLVPFRQV